MKNLLLTVLFLNCAALFAQTDSCPALLKAFPAPEKYDKYRMVQFPECTDGYVMAYYSFGEGDNEQLFSIILTDTKHDANQGMLKDAESKHNMAKTSTDKTSLKVSRFKLGAKSLVAHDDNEGLKRIYGYKTIIKNRYVLDIMANSDTIKNLDEFQDFIADYLLKINEGALPN